jgi:hypothetical protein
MWFLNFQRDRSVVETWIKAATYTGAYKQAFVSDHIRLTEIVL